MLDSQRLQASADLHRIKKHIGATAAQTLVVVTAHINHPLLFSSTQKL